MREIVVDTETTGLDPATGDRIVEIGCLELVNHIPSGRVWHSYVNPRREVSVAAFEVHGLSGEFLADKPVFADVAGAFLAFIADARLVIHNAPFDLGFLNAELKVVRRPPIAHVRVVDTLALARRKHPGASNSLDALCRRYRIDASSRTTHGALVDVELLAKVYVELIGGHQARLELSAADFAARAGGSGGAVAPVRPTPLPPRLSEAERRAHRAFVATLGEGAIWQRYLDGGEGD